MRMIIKSRKAGKSFNFWMSDNGGYIRLESEGEPGTLGQRICYGGGMMGICLIASPETFKAVCRRWYRSHIEKQYND